MHNSIVITVIGSDKAGFVHDLTRTINENNGNIIESRMIMLGTEFAVIMLVDANWHATSKIEHELKKHGQANDMQIVVRKSSKSENLNNFLPYEADLVTVDHPGIIHNISGFFSEKGITIGEIKSKQFHAPHTGAVMFQAVIQIYVPGSISISKLRDEFVQYCDQENIDGLLEPIKY